MKIMNANNVLKNILGKSIKLDMHSKNYEEKFDWEVKCPKCGSQFYRNSNIKDNGSLTCPNRDCDYSGKFKFIKKVED